MEIDEAKFEELITEQKYEEAKIFLKEAFNQLLSSESGSHRALDRLQALSALTLQLKKAQLAGLDEFLEISRNLDKMETDLNHDLDVKIARKKIEDL